MNRVLIALMVLTLFVTGCSANQSGSESISTESKPPVVENRIPEFTDEKDARLIEYLKGSIYERLIKDLGSENYYVEKVDAVYLSKEYIEELSYNSQSNIFFGYSLSELDRQFKGKRYVFDIGRDGQTIVREMEAIDDNTYQTILNNVLVGGGVILFCVTVSALAAPSAPAISVIFAASADTAATYAISGAAISGAAKTIVTAYETGDLEHAFKEGAISASESFKWGAFSGVLVGGTSEAISLYQATLNGKPLNGLTMNEAAFIQQESGLPLDVISQFKSMDEYRIYKNAGLKVDMVGTKVSLIRDIDLNYMSELPNGEKVSNLIRMQKGYAPLDPSTGLAYQLHHVNQDPNGTLAILTEAEHQGNSAILHIFNDGSKIDRQEFNRIRSQFWQDYAAMFGG